MPTTNDKSLLLGRGVLSVSAGKPAKVPAEEPSMPRKTTKASPELLKALNALLGPDAGEAARPAAEQAAPQGVGVGPDYRSPPRWSVTLTVPCRVRSEMNARDHWTRRRKRFKDQATAVAVAWLTAPVWWSQVIKAMPLRVTLTHVGCRMDGHDNLASGFKAVVDELARMLGIDDGDGRVTWCYEQILQHRGGCVLIRIEPRAAAGREGPPA